MGKIKTVENISIETIENGYLIRAGYFTEENVYESETWYAIHPDEVKQKLDKFL